MVSSSRSNLSWSSVIRLIIMWSKVTKMVWSTTNHTLWTYYRTGAGIFGSSHVRELRIILLRSKLLYFIRCVFVMTRELDHIQLGHINRSTRIALCTACKTMQCFNFTLHSSKQNCWFNALVTGINHKKMAAHFVTGNHLFSKVYISVEKKYMSANNKWSVHVIVIFQSAD